MTELRLLHAGVSDLVSDRCRGKGWELGDFAKKANIDRTTLYRVLRGTARPTDATLRGVARALGVAQRERTSLLVETEAQRVTRIARAQGVEL